MAAKKDKSVDYQNMSEADVAYAILKEGDVLGTMFYKDLILEVIKRKGIKVRNPENPEAEAISEIYTAINMDSRFMHVKKGDWSLAEWYSEPKRKTRTKDED